MSEGELEKTIKKYHECEHRMSYRNTYVCKNYEPCEFKMPHILEGVKGCMYGNMYLQKGENNEHKKRS